MNILCIGDVVGGNGCNFLRSKLPAIKRTYGIDVVIANGENASDGNGITPSAARHLFDSGVDIITLGNHTYRRSEVYDYLDETECILRPYNFPKEVPGHGMLIYDMGVRSICVINLMGQMYMDNVDCPFKALDDILKENSLPKIIIVDFHAEATGEKRAFGYYADGRVSAVFGTHTHVQTADEQILPNGTGYITDLGMCGVIDSVLGVDKNIVIEKFRHGMPTRFDGATGDCMINGCIFTIDSKTGKCTSVETIDLR